MLNFCMLKPALKFLLAFALCYWLFTNGKLDFTLITKSFSLGTLWIWGLLALLSRLFISSQRFKILLDTKVQSKIPFIKVLTFDAVGSFFSVILPGAAAGDLVRFFYYKNLSTELKPATIAALLILDRLIGVLALMALAIGVCLFQFDSIRELNPQLITLVFLMASFLSS